MKKRVIKIATIVLIIIAAAGMIARANSVSLSLALGGYKGDAVVIEEGVNYTQSPVRWREYITVSSAPAYGFQYGYDPFDMSDTMTHTENWKFAPVQIGRSDWFYHGTNAEYTVTVPEESLPVDSTLQIYQAGPEYVLHLCQYCKGDGAFDGGFEDIYRALLDNGSLKTE